MFKLKVYAAYLLWVLLLGAPSLYFKIENRDIYIDGWFDSDYNFIVIVTIVIAIIMGIMNYVR